MLQVVEINAIEHLEAIRLRWTSLLYATRGASFFHTLDWLKVYWQHFRASQRLRVLLVHRSGTLLGILPLVVREEMTATGPAGMLTYPTITPNQFFGPIGPNPTATLMASLRHLLSKSRDWDILSLVEIGEHDLGRTANAFTQAELHPSETVRTTIVKACLDASWAEYISNHQPGDRSCDTRRNKVEYEEHSCDGLTFERIRPLGNTYGDDRRVDGIIGACCVLEPRTLCREHPAALFRDVAAVASRLGMLDLNLLKLDGRLIAFSLNVHFDGAIQQLGTGETAVPFNVRPALVLGRRMLQDSFARKDRYMYFAASNDGLANLWATDQRSLVCHQHRATLPFRDRLTRLGRWLTSPATKV
jgi:hypothetical protein